MRIRETGESGRRITLADVAQRAGVTHTTVSLVISGNKRISEETRTKVLAVIKEMDYRPNRLARQLAGGKNNTIAILAAFFSSHFELEFMRGLQMAMGATDYHLNQYSTRGDTAYRDEIFDQLLFENRAEGVIALNLKPQPAMLAAYQKAGVPIVVVEEFMEGTISVRTDNRRGAQLATRHLIDRGYQNIALLCGAFENEEPGSSPRERFEGWRDTLTAAGRSARPELVYQTEDYEIDDGSRLLLKMREEHPEIDAVFCAAGDLVAFGLMRQAKKLGLRMPQDLAVVGYDNHFVSDIVSPALTTVNQPIYDMGQTALNVLVQTLRSTTGPVPSPDILVPELLVRETT